MNSPSTRPTRTPAIVCVNGMLDSASAAEAPVIASTSESLLGVGREHERDDLRLVAPAVREERPDRAIDQAAREHFLLGRLAFALEEPAGDASRRVGVFLVVDGQRQEVDAFARVGGRAGGDEDHRVARADDDGAVGLLGEPPGFDGDRAAADGNVRVCACVCLSSMSCASFLGVACDGPLPERAVGRARPGRRCYLRMPRRLISSA